MEDHQPESSRKSHGFVAMKSLYRLDQFDRVLALRNRDSLPYLLIGGQAVNFWAGLYAVRELYVYIFIKTTSRIYTHYSRFK